MEDFLESCRAPALLTELEDDDDGDDALDSDKENEPSYQDVVSIVCSRISFYFLFHLFIIAVGILLINIFLIYIKKRTVLSFLRFTTISYDK